MALAAAALVGMSLTAAGCGDAGSRAKAQSPDRRSGVNRTVHFRSQSTTPDEPPTVPPVLLTEEHAEICRIGVGDPMPEIELPRITGRGSATLADLYGSRATVVVFWKSDRRMSATELADLGPDVVEPYGSKGVAVVGIAVEETSSRARSTLRRAGAEFANLLDADGSAFALVGSERLPRTYLLDAGGKVLWFDIEYSLATRRELAQALAAIIRQEP